MNTNKLIIPLLASAIAFVSCTKEAFQDNRDTDKVSTVTLHLSVDEATKTYLEDDQFVCWSEGDVVWINDVQYPVAVNPDNPMEATVYNVIEAEAYLAEYSSYRNVLDGKHYYSLWSWQSDKVTSFDGLENPMVAYGTSTNLVFRNLASCIKIGLTGNGEKLDNVMIVSNSGQLINGVIVLSESDIVSGNINPVLDTERYNRLVYSQMYVNERDALSSEPQYYYILTAPFEDPRGITFAAMVDQDNVFIKRGTSAFSVGRSEIMVMPDLAFTAASRFNGSVTGASSNTISVHFDAEQGQEIVYLALPKSVWDSVDGDVRGIFFSYRNYLETAVITNGGVDVVINNAVNESGASAMTESTDYVIVAGYGASGVYLGGSLMLEASTVPAEGPVPSLDVDFGTSDIYIESRIYSDASDISVYSFDKDIYDALLAQGNSDAELISTYGQYLSENEIADANASGCEWIWGPFRSHTEHIILIQAVSSTGKSTIGKWSVWTDWHIFNPEETALQSVSKSACVTTDLFGNLRPEGGDTALGFIEISNLELLKLPGEDVFVIKNLFKGNETIQSVGFVDEEQDSYFIIDARIHDKVDISVWANDLGIYNTKYTGRGVNYSLGTYYSYLYAYINESTEPLGTYDVSEKQIVFDQNLVSYDFSGNLYGMYSLTLDFEGPADSESMTIGKFVNTTQDEW